MGFDIMSLQKGRGPVQARSKANEGCAVLKYIDVDDLVPSEDNFYSMSAIDELATLIELSGGVKQPALVVPLGGGKYKVIAGHRRRLASLQLVQQGKNAYRKMPCMVDADEREPGADADELRAIDEAILLITTNGQREKTDWDKVQEATRLRALLEQKRRFEKIPGETRKLIAEQLGTTPAQVGRYDSIAKHLMPEFKELLEAEKINISVAYELSTMTAKEQGAVLAEHGTRGGLSIEDVKRLREKLRMLEREVAESTASVQEQAATLAAGDGPKYKPGVYARKEGRKQTVEPPAGKVAKFMPPPPPPSVPPEPEKETLSTKRAAYILEDLQMFCEEMLGIDAEQPETWAERADALTVAISALRRHNRKENGK